MIMILRQLRSEINMTRINVLSNLNILKKHDVNVIIKDNECIQEIAILKIF